MTTLRAILDRFRPAAPPGRPGPAGIPTEARFTPADELAPVFALLDSVDLQCSSIRARATRDAGIVIRAAAERASVVEAEAIGAANRERATVAAKLRATAQTQLAEQISAAKQEADAIRAEGTRDVDSLVHAVVKKVRCLAEGAAADGAADGVAGENA